MPELLSWSLPASLLVFLLATAGIGWAGTALSMSADRLADRTGLGEVFVGFLLLAAVTSLPDFAATLTAVLTDRPELAMSNIMGSMAINMAFLAIADLFYREANLEHAAASSANLMLTGLLVTLLVIPLLAMVTPQVSVAGVHPASIALIVVYGFGLRLVRGAQQEPMWFPRHTALTVTEPRPEASPARGRVKGGLWLRFGLLALVVALSGFLVMVAGEAITVQTGLSETAVGALLIAAVTSFPELITTIAAVRHGAPALAVGNILGTNCFNTIVIATSDIGYRDGSIYHAISSFQLAWGLVSILMLGILLLGFVQRERYGIARMGFESFVILLIYLVTAGMTLVWA